MIKKGRLIVLAICLLAGWLGMAAAAAAKGEDRKCVAVIGDGAMTAGMAYEALNHGGDLDKNLLVVLNDDSLLDYGKQTAA